MLAFEATLVLPQKADVKLLGRDSPLVPNGWDLRSFVKCSWNCPTVQNLWEEGEKGGV